MSKAKPTPPPTEIPLPQVGGSFVVDPDNRLIKAPTEPAADTASAEQKES